MVDTSDLLKQGMAALKAGQKAQAKGLLVQALQQDKNNEQAWLWLSGAVETDAERRTCLENVLLINPNNKLARQALEQMSPKPASPPPLSPPPPVTEPPAEVVRPQAEPPPPPSLAPPPASEKPPEIPPPPPAKSRGGLALVLAVIFVIVLAAVGVWWVMSQRSSISQAALPTATLQAVDLLPTVTATAAMTRTPTPSPTASKTRPPTGTFRPTSTLPPSMTPRPTHTSSPTPTPVTYTPTPSSTPTPFRTYTPRPTPTTGPTRTPFLTYTPRPTPTPVTHTPTPAPTWTPVPTFTPRPTQGAQTPTMTPTPFTATLNQTQKVGPITDSLRDVEFSMEVTLESIEWTAGVPSDPPPRAGYIYGIVYVRVKNIGPGANHTVNRLDFMAKDADGKIINDKYMGFLSDCTLSLADLQVGEESQGCVAFELPLVGKVDLLYNPLRTDELEADNHLSFRLRR